MFFSIVGLNITGSADNRPFPIIIHLAIEDNLLKNNSNIFRFYHYVSPNYYDYYSYMALQSFFSSNIKVQFSEHVSQNQFVDIANLTATNHNSCSTGNRTYFYFPVHINAVNITGSVTIYLNANMLTNSVTRSRKYASSHVYLTIDNGEINLSRFFIIIIMNARMQVVVETYCMSSVAENVLKAVLDVQSQ